MKSLIKTSILITTLVFAVSVFTYGVSFVITDSTNVAVAYGVDEGYGNDGCCGGEESYSQGGYYSQSDYYSQGTYTVAASCDAFTGSPTTLPYGGGDVTLNWATTNATSVSIDNGVGTVSADGSTVVPVTGNTTFTLTAVGTGGNDNCTVSVTVQNISAPSCDAFTGSPTTLPYGGGDVTLNWATTNADNVSIDQGIGAVADDGSMVVVVASSKTFTLTASNVAGTVDCSVPVTVQQDSTFSCDYFNISKTPVEKGESFTLSWGTTNGDSVSIDQGIGAVADDGTYTTSTQEDKTYTLTVTKGSESKTCPVSVTVKTNTYSQGSYNNYSQGSYGGGSSKPRCDLDASATKINAGKEIKLTWETSNATEVTLTDSKGNILMTTDNLLSKDKKDFFDGEMTVRPVKDTTYTLLAERGSKDRECEVKIKVTDGVTVLEVRDQKPLIAGISLTQVPYTGFEAGPTLTIIFYTLLTLWALFVAYILVIRKDSIAGFSFAKVYGDTPYHDESVAAVDATEESEADAYVHAVITEETPANLPVADAAAVGYAAYNDMFVSEEEETLTALEDHAHAQKVLLSSDAMRYFAQSVVNTEEQIAKLDEVIAQAKISFPSEDGWVVLNLSRMEGLLSSEDADTSESPSLETPAAPTNSGSLAEAIVTGNIVAAYQMIESRPMVALADAASDLDAVYRSRKGEEVRISNMLATQVAPLSTEQLEAAIAALTGALDGTYTDEASAVKMAIMKAVKAVA